MAFPSPVPSGISPFVPLVNLEVAAVVICQPVYSDSLGGFKLALGDGSAKAAVVGLVADPSIRPAAAGNVAAANTFTATTAQWDAVCGTSGGLATGTKYYLSASVAGALTASSTSGVGVIRALSATTATLQVAGGSSGGASAPIAPLTIAGNITGASAAATGLTDIQARTVFGNTFISPKDVAYGAKGDGTTDDTAAIAAAITGALAAKLTLVIPPGTYKITSQGGSPPRALTIPAGANGLRIASEGAIINCDTSTCYAFYCPPTAVNVQFVGIKFQGFLGTGLNDKTINQYGALHVGAGATDITIDRCYFDHLQTAFFASDDFQRNSSSLLKFTNNTVVDPPLALNPPSNIIVSGNFFHDTAVLTGDVTHLRSHSIYCFGSVQSVIITGNSFKNQSDATIEIRANGAVREQKRVYDISNNTFEQSAPLYSLFISDLASEINVGTITIRGNRFKNGGGMQLLGLRDAVVEGNVLEYDYQYAFPAGSAIALGTSFGSGGECVARGNVFSSNRIVNRHPFWAQVSIPTAPADGDTITVGAVTYRWKTTPSAAGDIQISAAGSDANVTSLAYALQGRTSGGNARNKILRDLTDVWYSQNDAEQKLWVASRATFALSRTGTAVTVGAVNDFSGIVTEAFAIATTIGTLLTNNSVEGCRGISLADNTDVVVRGNMFTPGAAGTGIYSTGNAFPIFDSNDFIWDKSLLAPTVVAGQALMSYDAFPIIRNCGLVSEQSGAGGVRTLPWMTGESGVVTVGDGKATTYFYYGNDHGPTTGQDPAARFFQWQDGDEVQIYNNTSGVTWHFFFSATITSSTTQFNSYASFIALINASSGGSWVASNPVTAYYGSDSVANGYIQLKAGAVGTARNGDEISFNNDASGLPGPRTCGVYLRPWVDGGIYSNKSQAQFDGGSAAKTRTVVYTPLASKQRPLLIQGVDAASQALGPIAYQADTVPGMFYVITHTAAAGTEKFLWKVG